MLGDQQSKRAMLREWRDEWVGILPMLKPVKNKERATQQPHPKARNLPPYQKSKI